MAVNLNSENGLIRYEIPDPNTDFAFMMTTINNNNKQQQQQ